MIRKLAPAGAVFLGRTNLDEFAMGSSTENSAFRTTRNPWDTERIPGGSSGGSAAAVASRMAPLALGSDTGGSIRQPAALCGVLGLKPTYGRVSRFGLVAFASSLDQIGPFATTARDAALLLQVIAGHDDRDSTSVDQPVPDYAAALQKGLEGPAHRAAEGILYRRHGPGSGEGRPRGGEGSAKASARRVKEISLPHTEYCLAVYYILAPSEASSNLSRFDGVRYGHQRQGGQRICSSSTKRAAAKVSARK